MQVPAAFTVCPEDGLLALFIERALDPPVADRMRDHLDDCDTCRRGVMAWVELRSPPSAALEVEAELQLGHFMLRRRLGAGGMGVVYAAFDTRLRREVAIKLLVSANDPSADRMLLDEARAQARVAHPSVLTVYEVDEVDGVHYIAMELIRGRTLRAHLAAQRSNVSTILRLYAHAARGLAAAHALGVIHRDFKPDNVLVEEDPVSGTAVRVVVADFGLAALTDTHDSSSPGAGTPGYMAPEQHDGGAVDARADVFSFAVALWESLYKERPYQRGAAGPLVPPSRSDVPAATRAWLVQALALDPEQRPGSIETALAVLVPQPKRGRAVVVAAASLAVAGVVGAWAWTHVAASAPTEACDATLVDSHTWEFQATASGVPAWARARVTQAMATRARDVATRGAAACAASRPAERQAWTACRAEQLIIERETLAALARPWSTYARIDDALDLPWVSTCTTRAAELALVLEPSAPDDRRALDEARATLARIELAWQAGRPRAEWEAQLAALNEESPPPAVHAAIAVERRLLEAALASEVDGRKPLPLLETAVADAERSGDLVGAARAWLFLARMRAGRGDPKAPAAFEQAGWAIERIGDPPALRATWHASMTGVAWSKSDLPAALAHARNAAALEKSGGASRHRALSALASAAGASAQFGEQRRALEQLLSTMGEPTLDHVYTWSMYAESLYHLGENADALGAIERALAIADQLLLRQDPVYATSMLIRSFIELELGRTEDCLATIAEVERFVPHVVGLDHEVVGAALNIKASALGAKHDWTGALAAAEAAAAFFTRTRGARDFSALHARQTIGEFAKQTGDVKRAEAQLRAVLVDARTVFGPDDTRTASIEAALGALVPAPEARQLFEHSLASYRAAEVDPAEAAQPAASLVEILLASPVKADRARALELAAASREAWRGKPYWSVELADLERVVARAGHQVKPR